MPEIIFIGKLPSYSLDIYQDNSKQILNRTKFRRTRCLFHQTNDFDHHLFSLLSLQLVGE